VSGQRGIVLTSSSGGENEKESNDVIGGSSIPLKWTVCFPRLLDRNFISCIHVSGDVYSDDEIH